MGQKAHVQDFRVILFRISVKSHTVKISIFPLAVSFMMLYTACQHKPQPKSIAPSKDFKFLTEQFADLKVMRYQVPGFDELSAKQKELIYYLSQATLCGRDIIFEQNGKYNLPIRHTLENIYLTYRGDKQGAEWEQFVVYLKKVWFSNGVYHHYASEKFEPGFSKDYFDKLIKNSDSKGFPLRNGQTVAQLVAELTPVMFDPQLFPKKVNMAQGQDLVKTSAVNFYSNVSQAEVEALYAVMHQADTSRPLSFGLNSDVVKDASGIHEVVWKVGGKYSPALEKIVFWLQKAASVAENSQQKAVIEKLIQYYQTGDLQTWDDYNVLWVEDLQSNIDFVNGFIENYEDPLSRKATWEAIVNFKDMEATHRAETISANAQWFEDHSPVDPRFRKKSVKGVTAKVITAAQLGGDCYPSTPIGINLPNADWIRKEHGSKSVTIENITYAYDQAAQGNGMLEEFVNDTIERRLAKEYGSLASNVHTDLHECLGHGSGQLLPGTSGEALKNYQNTLEEARADLFALYYMMDPKLVELGVLPSADAAKAEYNSYMRNGLLTQLTRIKPGKNIEEAHMRNRQLIARWCYEQGKGQDVVDFIKLEGKTYIKINDYEKLRQLFGKLLAEIQRIKSEGDFAAGQKLVETYGVKVDKALHQEILARFEKLKIAPYGGFINPKFVPVEKDGKIVDVHIEYPEDFAGQMLEYSRNFSFLPSW